jgi:hypothetical protein
MVNAKVTNKNCESNQEQYEQADFLTPHRANPFFNPDCSRSLPEFYLTPRSPKTLFQDKAQDREDYALQLRRNVYWAVLQSRFQLMASNNTKIKRLLTGKFCWECGRPGVHRHRESIQEYAKLSEKQQHKRLCKMRQWEWKSTHFPLEITKWL